jgi:catalase (peroxidase I)
MKTLKLTQFAAEVEKLALSVGQAYSCVKVGITTSKWKDNPTEYQNEFMAYINGYNWVAATTPTACLDAMKKEIKKEELIEIVI